MKVTLISTVRDAGPFIGDFLDSIREQTRPPDEVVIVDGGSTDETLGVLRAAPDITLIEVPGANIPAGRVAAIRAATHDVIAVSDADCVLTPRWLELLATAIESGADVAMGSYRPIVGGFFEACSAATQVPEIDELDEATFMPSSRSVAFTREAYERAGGYPEWLDVGEDMYLNHRLRDQDAVMTLVPDAVTMWRVRPTLEATWNQYFNYAKGDAIAGMWPKRHALRFGVYAALPLLLRSRWGQLLVLAGGIAYAWRPLRRAFRLLSDPKERAAAVAAVPTLMAFSDIAKMAGYISGLRARGSRD
ncbi:MAG: glycosyltransferase [Actinomycetota bacterium]